jgi:hypothetical protein
MDTMCCSKSRLAGILLVVFLCSSLSWSADLKGDWQESCHVTMFHLKQSHNSKSQESVLTMDLPYQFQLLRLLPDWASPKWWDVTAKWCTSPDLCEDATKARIQFKKKYGAHVAGNYEVEFAGGRKEARTFVLKFRRMKPMPVCD